MAIRNAKLGGTDFTDGEVLYDYDLDDTNNAIIDQQVTVDAFTYVDDTELTVLGTTFTKVRTYTFNQAVDMVEFGADLRSDTVDSSSYNVYIQLYKNGVIIPETKLHFNSNSVLADFSFYLDESTPQILALDRSVYRGGFTVLITDSFAVNDTLEIYIKSEKATNTAYCKKRQVKGINNVSSDTTWVSLS